MANKKTQKDFFNEIIEVLNEVGRDDLVEFCNDRIDKLSRKSSSKKPTKTQVENEGLKDVILTVLTPEGMTASEVLASADEFSGLSNQKISTLLNQLVKDGKIEKVTDSRKSIFKAL